MMRKPAKSTGHRDRVAVILAGGQSQRMGGRDKATIYLNGSRLVDHLVERLRPQADHLLISGRHDYGTGLVFLPDAPDAPRGPAGGVYTVHQWLAARDEVPAGFVTAPVDGPFLPGDLVERLMSCGGPSLASDGTNDHPTFAYWTLDELSRAWSRFTGSQGISLRRLAELCGARRVVWRDSGVFFNINDPEDLEAAGRERTA